MLSRRRKLFLFFIALVVLPLVGMGVYVLVFPKPGITRDNFLRLHTGMTKAQINSILGSAGEPDPVTTHPEIDRLAWKEADKEVFAFFDDGKAVGGSFCINDQRIEILPFESEPPLMRIRRWVKERTGW